MFFVIFFFKYIKISIKSVYLYIKIVSKIQEKKERLQRKAWKRYQKNSFFFLKKKKGKRQQYGCEHYKSLSEDEKQKLVEYKKNMEWEKMPYYNYKVF